MGCVIICFKTSKTLPNFPHDTKSNKELQTVIFCTEGMAFDWHVSRGSTTAAPPLWRQNWWSVRACNTDTAQEPESTLWLPEQVLWQPKEAVLPHSGRSAKQQLSTKQTNMIRNVEWSQHGKADMRFGTEKVRRFYKSVSLKTVNVDDGFVDTERQLGRLWWTFCLMCWPATSRLLESRLRNPLTAGIFVSFVWCVRSSCWDKLITQSEESYWICVCVCVCV